MEKIRNKESSYPVGKVDSLTLHPLNFQEYISVKQPDLLPFTGPIDWLVKTGLALPVYLIEQPAIPLRSRRKANRFKLYLFDTGLLGTMADIPFESILNQDYGTYKGYMAENFTAQELAASGVREFFSWQGRTSEIEYLLTCKDKIIPVEVKSGIRTRARSLEVYRNKFNPELCVKISAGSISRRDNELNIPLYCAGKLKTILLSAIQSE